MRISDWSSDVCSSDLVRLWTMHQMSSSIAGMLEEGRVPNTEAALAKDLGTRFEQDIPEAARTLFGEELRASFDDDDMVNETLRYSTLYAHAYSIRGGTKEILRGIIAQSLGLRIQILNKCLQMTHSGS